MTSFGEHPAVSHISGETSVAAVIGKPIRHSLSPAICNAAFGALGLDWVYVAFEVSEAQTRSALEAMRELGLGGLSVTMPGKERAAALVDRLAGDAVEVAAVNCVAREGDELVGYNTDGAGLVDAVRKDLGAEIAGRRCAVVGAGGAGRAAVLALARAGASEVLVVNRTESKGEAAAAVAGGRARLAAPAELAGVSLVVNATPVGMAGRADALPIPAECLSADMVVVDLVYEPPETALVAAARARGATAVNGLGMLVHQAGHQIRIWTGHEPPLAEMRSAAEWALRSRS